MSGECECGEHCLDCICDEDLTSCSELPTELAASIIKRNLEETQLMLALKDLVEAEMEKEFEKFVIPPSHTITN